MRHVVPGRVHRQRRIQQRLAREIRLFSDCPPKPSCREADWPAYLEVFRSKLFDESNDKNIGPGFTPNSLCERVIIRAQFFFNVSGQRGTEPAITGVGTIVLTKMVSEFHLAFFRLKPGHFFSNLA